MPVPKLPRQIITFCTYSSYHHWQGRAEHFTRSRKTSDLLLTSSQKASVTLRQLPPLSGPWFPGFKMKKSDWDVFWETSSSKIVLGTPIYDFQNLSIGSKGRNPVEKTKPAAGEINYPSCVWKSVILTWISCSLKSENQRRSDQVSFSVTKEGFSHTLSSIPSFINISLVLALCAQGTIFSCSLYWPRMNKWLGVWGVVSDHVFWLHPLRSPITHSP